MTNIPCDWLEYPDRPGYWYCPHCNLPLGGPRGQRRPIDGTPTVWRKCAVASPLVKPDPQPHKPPTPKERLKSWRDATAAWKAAGSPERTSAEQHALADICRGCELYKPDPLLPIVMGGGQCGACGCGLKPERNLFNALRFGTYKCKKGKWDAAIAAGVLYVEPPPADKRQPDPDDGRQG